MCLFLFPISKISRTWPQLHAWLYSIRRQWMIFRLVYLIKQRPFELELVDCALNTAKWVKWVNSLTLFLEALPSINWSIVFTFPSVLTWETYSLLIAYRERPKRRITEYNNSFQLLKGQEWVWETIFSKWQQESMMVIIVIWFMTSRKTKPFKKIILSVLPIRYLFAGEETHFYSKKRFYEVSFHRTPSLTGSS